MTAPVTYAQAEGYWIAAGGDKTVAPIMAAIAQAESSLIPDNTQQGQPYATTGWGLWQITPGDSEPQCGTDSGLNDPAKNACAAVAKYNAQGLGAWTTYSSGAYKQYLNSSTTPDTNVSGGSAAAPSEGGAVTDTNECLVNFSLPSIPVLGSLGGFCILSKSQGRAIMGALLVGTAGLIGVVSLAVLVSGIKHGNTGVKHASGAVGNLFKHPDQAVTKAKQSPDEVPAAAANPPAVAKPKSKTPIKDATLPKQPARKAVPKKTPSLFSPKSLSLDEALEAAVLA